MIIVRLCMWLFVTGLVASPVIAGYGLENAPLVTENSKIVHRNTPSTKILPSYLNSLRVSNGDIATNITKNRNVETALSAALAAIPHLKLRVTKKPLGLLVEATSHASIPTNLFGQYINVRVLLIPTMTDLKVVWLRIGRIEIPGPIIEPIYTIIMK
ncbi:MAG: hypothetical protein CFH41_00041 [Alphaproteobacteria bacterium MarineAlpha11_Bin1]|nr:MAG: hypothetical protein CFH41_00041 [Alphaproteobacteria bacterium MarineAlpha11_Bin1]